MSSGARVQSSPPPLHSLPNLNTTSIFTLTTKSTTGSIHKSQFSQNLLSPYTRTSRCNLLLFIAHQHATTLAIYNSSVPSNHLILNYCSATSSTFLKAHIHYTSRANVRASLARALCPSTHYTSRASVCKHFRQSKDAFFCFRLFTR